MGLALHPLTNMSTEKGNSYGWQALVVIKIIVDMLFIEYDIQFILHSKYLQTSIAKIVYTKQTWV